MGASSEVPEGGMLFLRVSENGAGLGTSVVSLKQLDLFFMVIRPFGEGFIRFIDVSQVQITPVNYETLH